MVDENLTGIFQGLSSKFPMGIPAPGPLPSSYWENFPPPQGDKPCNVNTHNFNDDLELAKVTLGRRENVVKMTKMEENGLLVIKDTKIDTKRHRDTCF